jgi:hypothetical protein
MATLLLYSTAAAAAAELMQAVKVGAAWWWRRLRSVVHLCTALCSRLSQCHCMTQQLHVYHHDETMVLLVTYCCYLPCVSAAVCFKCSAQRLQIAR